MTPYYALRNFKRFKKNLLKRLKFLFQENDVSLHREYKVRVHTNLFTS